MWEQENSLSRMRPRVQSQSWYNPFFQALYIFTQEESVSWRVHRPPKAIVKVSVEERQGKIPWVQLPSTILIPPVAMMCVDRVICERQLNELHVQLVLESLVLLSISWQDRVVLAPLPWETLNLGRGEGRGSDTASNFENKSLPYQCANDMFQWAV